MLYGATHTVASRRRGHVTQRVEVNRHFGDRAIRQDDAAMRRTRIDADLRQAASVATEHAEKALDEGFELFDRAVLLADLADLPTDRDREARLLQVANQRRELRAAFVVVPLLLGKGREGEVDQR